MAAIKKYNGSTWETTTARKYETATETIQSGDTIYADGTAATVSLKGNEQHTGTPSPSNPVDVNGVGERTENLFDYETMKDGKIGYYLDASGNEIENTGFWSITKYIPVDGTVFTLTRTFIGNAPAICLYDSNKNFITGVSYQGEQVVTISSNTNAAYIRFSYFISEPLEDIAHDMLNSGSTAKPYEPYGYKIPISSGGVTTNIYLGNVQTVRQIKKFVLTGDESGWSMSGTGLFYNLTLPDNPKEMFTVISTHFTATTNPGSVEIGCIRFAGTEQSPTQPLVFNYDNGAIGLTAFKQWVADQYANGTPVTVWYVLATPETAAVNEPLMKIGDYADTLSNATAIPTTEGANSISVDTTVQPSEVSATYTGWHDSTVKEWDGSQWNE